MLVILIILQLFYRFHKGIRFTRKFISIHSWDILNGLRVATHISWVTSGVWFGNWELLVHVVLLDGFFRMHDATSAKRISSTLKSDRRSWVLGPLAASRELAHASVILITRPGIIHIMNLINLLLASAILLPNLLIVFFLHLHHGVRRGRSIIFTAHFIKR